MAISTIVANGRFSITKGTRPGRNAVWGITERACGIQAHAWKEAQMLLYERRKRGNVVRYSWT